MFTRQPSTSNRSIADIARLDKSSQPARNGGVGSEPAEHATDSPPPISGGRSGASSSQGRAISIIGNDLTIVGQGLRIVTRGTLQVDGHVEGDVIGDEVIIGEKGRVCGVVSGRSVEVRGEVAGTVKAIDVALRASARVEGDVHHRQLTVEQGAHLDGRVRRPTNDEELAPDLSTEAVPAHSTVSP